MARKKKNSTATSWLDGAQEVPRENVVANKDRSNRQKFYRGFIIASVVLLPISLLTTVLTFGANSAPDPISVVQDAEATEGKAVAILSLQSWLTSDRSPVPGIGRMVSWDGFDVVERPVLTAEEEKRSPLPAYELEIHHFSVVDGQGTTYVSDVQVAVDPASGAHALGTPSLMPVAISTDSGIGSGASPWYGFTRTSPPEPVSSAITAWAKAFTSGDPDALRLAVHDEDASHTYVPLYNVVSHSVQAGQAAFIPDAGHDPKKPVASASQMLVQVTFTIQWAGAPDLKPGESAPTITYDLLVDKVGGGAPYVVAWGGPGFGPQLSEHYNALTGRAVVKAPSAPAKTTPMGTETDSETDAADETTVDGEPSDEETGE